MLTVGRYGTHDLPRAKIFYDTITKLAGIDCVMERPDAIGYKGAEGVMFMIGKPHAGEATFGNGTQLSFNAPTRAAVDAIHKKALELGGKCEGPPGVRGPDPNGFYGAYFRDPDGNKLMVFRMGPP